ncbi:MAG: PaaI family thioesterase [Bacteroidales bacterium]|nr:PaaI family thioesterase [Bacteroidales bacterium]
MTLKDILNTNDHFASNAGVKLTEIAPGTAVATMEVTAAHLNAGGVCQGGAIFTLADLVFAALVNQGEGLTFSINSTIYYHFSAKEGDTVRAEGHISCDHRRIPSVEVVITNQDGVRIATFTGQAYNTGRNPIPFDSLQ